MILEPASYIPSLGLWLELFPLPSLRQNYGKLPLLLQALAPISLP